MLSRFSKKTFSNWTTYFIIPPKIPFCTLNLFLWNNKYIQNISRTGCFKRFSEKGLTLSQIYLMSIEKQQVGLSHVINFQCFQLNNVLQKWWKTLYKNVSNNGCLTVKDHHIIQKRRTILINKLSAREQHWTLTSYIENKPDS